MLMMRERGRERERERQRDRDRETETETERQRDRDRKTGRRGGESKRSNRARNTYAHACTKRRVEVTERETF